MSNKLPELINLNDSVASLTDFLQKIPEEIHEPFDYKYPNGLILEDIVTQLLKQPRKTEEQKIIINDVGYDNVISIDSILGIQFTITNDLETLLNEQTQIVFDKFQETLPKEKESQSTSIVNVQIGELENFKGRLQSDIANLTGLQNSIHKLDVRQDLINQLIESKKQNIRTAQQSINLFTDQLMFRKMFQSLNQYISQLIYSVLKLETTLTFRTSKLELQLQMSCNERELIQQREITKLKQKILENEKELENIQNQIQFNVSHYEKLEQQIGAAKLQIQRQLQAIKKQKEDKEKDDRQKTSSPSAMSQSKSNISDLEILKQQTRKVSNSYAHRNRFKTIFFKR